MTARTAVAPRRQGRAEELAALADAIRAVAPADRPLDVLEAGCGHHWPIKVPDTQLSITGIDLDPAALEIRKAKHQDLDDYIIGDLRTVPLPTAAFDLAYCSFVLEHVEGAEGVLDRLADALRPGGRLLLRVPDGRSIYGFAAKHTPHWTHVLFVRYVRGNKNAGKPGHTPYPTVYDDVITLDGMQQWAARRGLTVTDVWASNHFMKFFGRFRPVVQRALDGVARVSRGRLTAAHNNLAFVVDKPVVDKPVVDKPVVDKPA